MMWQDIIDQKEKWIGGKLVDEGDFMDRADPKTPGLPMETEIVGFELTDEYFEVKGRDFNCGGTRDILGISPEHVDNGLVLRGYGGHIFSIIMPDNHAG